MVKSREINDNAHIPVVMEAYAVVSTKDDDDDDNNKENDEDHTCFQDAPLGMRVAGGLDRELTTRDAVCGGSMVSAKYAYMRETNGLMWEDDFFEDDIDDDIVAVFDFDYDMMQQYYSSVSWTFFGATSVFVPISLLAGVPCHINKNVDWSVRSQHVAVTRDGIKYVQDKRPTCWGLPCTDAGRRSKMIPFDQITDCDIIEAAGNTCVCIQNTLDVVHLDTVGHSNGLHELTIVGLKDPQGFRKLVLAMKREYRPPLTAKMNLTTAVEKLKRATSGSHQENIATLLRDIRDELRKNNNQDNRGLPTRRHKLIVSGLSRNTDRRIRKDYHPAVAKAIAMIERTSD